MFKMEVTCLVIGDPHFKTSDVKVSLEMCEKTTQCAQELNPDFIVVLGDVLHNHGLIYESPLNRAVKWLKDLSDIKHTFVLIGNHDMIDNSQFLGELHAFNALKYWENITIVDRPVQVNRGGKSFVFVPFVPLGRFQEALSLLENWKEADAIFAHQEFLNVKMGTHVSILGDPWDLSFPQVISGHIHTYQKVQENLLYIGTPYQHEHGGTRKKSISMFTFNGSEIIEKRINLGLRSLKTYRVNLDEIDRLKDINIDENTRIIISGDVSNLSKLKKNTRIGGLFGSGSRIYYRYRHCVPKTEHTFRSGLYCLIKDEPPLVNLFEELFG